MSHCNVFLSRAIVISELNRYNNQTRPSTSCLRHATSLKQNFIQNNAHLNLMMDLTTNRPFYANTMYAYVNIPLM